MATGNTERIILRSENYLSDGHRVQFDFVVGNLTARESFVLDENFFTSCENYSTSWKLRMIILPVREDGLVNIPVTIRRFDTRNCAVNASVNVSLSDKRSENFFGDPRNYTNPRMMSGDELLGYVSGFLPLSHQRTSFNEMLVIRTIVEIFECHGLVNMFHATNFNTGYGFMGGM